MKFLNVILCLTIIAAQACAQSPSEVRLFGKITGLTPQLKSPGMAGTISDYGAIDVPVDKEGNFDITLRIDKPTYYKMGRNVLYLTPGDEMEANIDRSESKSWYKGKGEVANNYLTGMVYPQNGGFMKSGNNVKEDFAATKVVVSDLYNERLQKLESLKGVSDEFREIERIRLRADIVQSYIGYLSYSDMLRGVSTNEEGDKIVSDFLHMIAPDVNPIIREISAKEEYFEIPSVRSIVSLAPESYGAFETPKLPERYLEYVSVDQKESIFNEDMTPEIYEEAVAFTARLNNRDFADSFLYRLEKNSKLMVGRPAIDLDLEAPDGTRMKLSDLKGRTIYIDFWATWCGPCTYESPHFAELSTKFPDIMFLGLSTDSNKEAWRNNVKAKDHGSVVDYLCQDPKVGSEWDITGIPHFLLIAKDFNIISANAPRPSDKDNIEAVLKELSER